MVDEKLSIAYVLEHGEIETVDPIRARVYPFGKDEGTCYVLTTEGKTDFQLLEEALFEYKYE